MSDIFVVSTWNTDNDFEILTGKFYESLANKKPVIGIVSGSEPNSELAHMINEYNLGICYEEAEGTNSYAALVNYVERQLENKNKGKPVSYEPGADVFKIFDYTYISKQLYGYISE